MKKATLKMTQTALIASAALVLSALEMMLPDIIPLPGVKYGLSNIAVMFSLVIVDLPSALFVCLVKAVFALISRGLSAFLMSLSGGVVSALIMFLLIYIGKQTFGYLGIGIAGAFSHNLAQLTVASCLLDKTVFAYLPVLSLVSLLSGSITSLVLYTVIPPLSKIRIFHDDSVNQRIF